MFATLNVTEGAVVNYSTQLTAGYVLTVPMHLQWFGLLSIWYEIRKLN